MDENGRRLGELGMFMALCGDSGVPVVMATGDRAAVQEGLALVPDMGTVVTKQALCPFLAKSISPAKARRLIREKAAVAVRRFKEIKPFRIGPPYEFIVHTDQGKAPFIWDGDLVEGYTKYLNLHGGHQAGLQAVGLPQYDRHLDPKYQTLI